MKRSTLVWPSVVMLGALGFAQMALAHPDIEEFSDTAFAEQPVTVDCTLENGTASTCYKITVNYLPEGLEIGPFCPATMEGAGGVWEWTGENAKLYRVDGAFLKMLDDLGYRFFDDDGTIHIVDIATEQPAVDHACINVSPDESVEITMLLPATPMMADSPTRLGTVSKVGVALDGVPIFSDAPSVQATGHMPALDTCGGHIDPGGWYHWHATSTDIETVYEKEGVDADCALEQNSAALFGYAFDGFAMFGSREADGAAVTGLDTCNGHIGATPAGETYHYHATDDFPNLPACLVGVQAMHNFSTTATAGVGATRAGLGGRNEPPRPGGGASGQMPPGFEVAAEALGVTPDALMQALGDPQAGPPDMAVAAEKLGITEDALRAALPPPPNR
ncbi:YHYH protein [Pseudorhodobacter turbinis]|uniref:YHYH protein n=1 Tax=Pseudorhodobacter turbinis TaxID=2500533 RepID=A0A4P8ECE2_9RHOB|nr:YHYH protein [Pseudorhodobacter turbinis]QCO54521.1 YHYH protein [Pseudorhodobacter turbinis]